MSNLVGPVLSVMMSLLSLAMCGAVSLSFGPDWLYLTLPLMLGLTWVTGNAAGA